MRTANLLKCESCGGLNEYMNEFHECGYCHSEGCVQCMELKELFKIDYWIHPRCVTLREEELNKDYYQDQKRKEVAALLGHEVPV